MSKVYYNKLVRDNIKAIIEAKGEACEVRTITDTDEFHQELLKKVMEEARALAMVRTREEYLNEYTDLLLVLETLNEHLGLSETDIADAKVANLAERVGTKTTFSCIGRMIKPTRVMNLRRESLRSYV